MNCCASDGEGVMNRIENDKKEEIAFIQDDIKYGVNRVEDDVSM